MMTWEWLREALYDADDDMYLSVSADPRYADADLVPDGVIFAGWVRKGTFVTTDPSSIETSLRIAAASARLRDRGLTLHVHDDYEDGVDFTLAIYST